MQEATAGEAVSTYTTGSFVASRMLVTAAVLREKTAAAASRRKTFKGSDTMKGGVDEPVSAQPTAENMQQWVRFRDGATRVVL